jgi:hypothetical protein
MFIRLRLVKVTAAEVPRKYPLITSERAGPGLPFTKARTPQAFASCHTCWVWPLPIRPSRAPGYESLKIYPSGPVWDASWQEHIEDQAGSVCGHERLEPSARSCRRISSICIAFDKAPQLRGPPPTALPKRDHRGRAPFSLSL